MNNMESLIKAFQKLPKHDAETTYMELCGMTGGRFEDRCSNILQFFFSPQREHRLRGLFLHALYDLLDEGQGKLHEEIVGTTDIVVRREETTEERKRIDLTIVTPTRVIAIENKIGAALYNDLGNYSLHVDRAYKDRQKILVVLSMRHIIDSNERKKMAEHHYHYITYQQFFDSVKSKMGYYIADGNPKYITFLMDFIKTLENKMGNCNNEEKAFFTKYSSDIENLIARYEQYRTDILQEQKEAIAQLLDEAKKEISSAWWVYAGIDLGATFNEETNKIGIESWFIEQNGDPTAQFQIFITTWNKEAFTQEYRQAIDNEGIAYERADNAYRVYLKLPLIVKDPQQESSYFKDIIRALKRYFVIMERICKETK